MVALANQMWPIYVAWYGSNDLAVREVNAASESWSMMAGPIDRAVKRTDSSSNRTVELGS